MNHREFPADSQPFLADSMAEFSGMEFSGGMMPSNFPFPSATDLSQQFPSSASAYDPSSSAAFDPSSASFDPSSAAAFDPSSSAFDPSASSFPAFPPSLSPELLEQLLMNPQQLADNPELLAFLSSQMETLMPGFTAFAQPQVDSSLAQTCTLECYQNRKKGEEMCV